MLCELVVTWQELMFVLCFHHDVLKSCDVVCLHHYVVRFFHSVMRFFYYVVIT